MTLQRSVLHFSDPPRLPLLYQQHQQGNPTDLKETPSRNELAQMKTASFGPQYVIGFSKFLINN